MVMSGSSTTLKAFKETDGLSFNKKTGAISGVPIVASDPVIYTVTAIGRRGQDTATVVITVGVGTTNLITSNGVGVSICTGLCGMFSKG
jgi:hypothetical protein